MFKNKTILACILIAITILLASAVYAAGEIKVDDGEYYFYGTNEPAYESGYFASVTVDGENYYFDDATYDKMCEYDSKFTTGFAKQFDGDSNSVDVKNAAGFKVGSISSEKTTEPFTQNVGKSFSFDFEEGEVGLNSHAKIIKTVYDDSGNKL